jgi:hypothetical protein
LGHQQLHAAWGIGRLGGRLRGAAVGANPSTTGGRGRITAFPCLICFPRLVAPAAAIVLIHITVPTAASGLVTSCEGGRLLEIGAEATRHSVTAPVGRQWQPSGFRCKDRSNKWLSDPNRLILGAAASSAFHRLRVRRAAI